MKNFALVATVLTVLISCTDTAVNQNDQGAETEENTGCLIIAHGFTSEWNEAVSEAVSELTGGDNELFELCFLEDPYGNAGESYITPQHAYDRLVERGVTEIVVMPLFIDSKSNHIDEVKFVTGLGELEDAEEEIVEARIVTADAPIVGITDAIDGHSAIGKGLAALIPEHDDPELDNYVILVAHGPNTDNEDPHWIDGLEVIMDALLSELPDGFATETHVMTLRVHDANRYHERLGELTAILKEFLGEGEVFLVYNHLRAGYMDSMVVQGFPRSPEAFPGVLGGLTETELANFRHITTDICDLGVVPQIIRDRMID